MRKCGIKLFHNENQRNNHRHVFVHKKPPEKYHQPLQSPKRQNIHMEGSRIINLHKLKHHLNQSTIHSAQCRGAMTLHAETRYGLASNTEGSLWFRNISNWSCHL